MFLRDGRGVERGLETQRLKTVVTDFLDFSITHVSGRRKRCAEGWKKYVLHFRWRDGNWRSYAREMGPQIIYYSIVSRELPRIATRCDATRRGDARRDKTRRPFCVIFHGAIDDNAIRGSGRRCRRNFSSVKKFHRGAFRVRTSEFRNNEKRHEFKTLVNVIIMERYRFI